jgi:hydrogenase nickel incorporation protein HypA/HybF
MHEYSIAEELINTLLDQVDEDKLSDTEIVHLEIGELQVISREALTQAFKIATEGTLLEESELRYEEVPLLVSCEDCEFQGEVNYEDDYSLHFSVPVLTCPECGSSVDIVKGNELAVKSLTVSKGDSDE